MNKGDRAKKLAKYLLSNPWEKVYQVWLLSESIIKTISIINFLKI